MQGRGEAKDVEDALDGTLRVAHGETNTAAPCGFTTGDEDPNATRVEECDVRQIDIDVSGGRRRLDSGQHDGLHLWRRGQIDLARYGDADGGGVLPGHGGKRHEE
ncbi:MAG TPA: hypothetical protein VFZ63_15750 [Jiangellaceae bacterium]